jgi:hypothetical protein
VDVSFIKLETNDHCLIDKGIKQIEMYDNRLFILTGGRFDLFVFTMSGEFLTSIGGKGNGPGEYGLPISFSIDHTRGVISVVDLAFKKIVNYSLGNFEYVSEKAMEYDCFGFEYLGKDKIVWKNIAYESEYAKWNYIVSDTDYMYLNGYVERTFITGYSTGASKNIYKTDEAVYAYAQYDPTIYCFSEDEVYPIYNLKFGKHKLPPIDYLEKISANYANFLPELDMSNYLFFYSVYDTENALNVYYSVSKVPYIGIYDKKNNKTYNYSKEKFQNELRIGEIESPSGVINEYAVAALMPYCFFDEEDENYTLNEKLQPIVSQSHPEDNPILVLFKPK